MRFFKKRDTKKPSNQGTSMNFGSTYWHNIFLKMILDPIYADYRAIADEHPEWLVEMMLSDLAHDGPLNVILFAQMQKQPKSALVNLYGMASSSGPSLLQNIKNPGHSQELDKMLSEASKLTDQKDFFRRIQIMESAIKLVDRTTNALTWGILRFQIGQLYNHNPVGSAADNSEDAISCLVDAAPVLCHFSGDPNQSDAWHRLLYEMGMAFGKRSYGEKIENTQSSIRCFESLLAEIKAGNEFWLRSNYELGYHYQVLFLESSAEMTEKSNYLDKSINYFKEAKKAFPKDGSPQLILQTEIGLSKSEVLKNTLR